MVKNRLPFPALFIALFLFAFGCGGASADNDKAEGIKIRVTIAELQFSATLVDNATSRAFIARMPLTLPMEPLYGREMCYRFPEPLPAEEARRSGYEVGDIAYWTPRNSFVIFYGQNGEVIDNLQKVGRFDSDIEMLAVFGDREAVEISFDMEPLD